MTIQTQAEATVIADSTHKGSRITTFQLRYWRPIHAEVMTHRVFSRNAGSSRARPSKAIIDQVFENPWGPIEWGSNKPGMQAGEQLTPEQQIAAKDQWELAARFAAMRAEKLRQLKLHKQVVNRILEPYTYIDVVLTSTAFNNFWYLRDHPDADPGIQQLTQVMKAAYDQARPNELREGEWHLPYITVKDWADCYQYAKYNRVTRDEPREEEVLSLVQKISAARCARVSYKAFDGNPSSIDSDLALFDKLVVSQPVHASPSEHQATPDIHNHSPHLHGNLKGWVQFRKTLPNEWVAG